MHQDNNTHQKTKIMHPNIYRNKLIILCELVEQLEKAIGENKAMPTNFKLKRQQMLTERVQAMAKEERNLALREIDEELESSRRQQQEEQKEPKKYKVAEDEDAPI